MIRIVMYMLIVLAAYPIAARAQGLLDFLDPCIGAKQTYWQEHGSLVQNFNFQQEAISSTSPTNNFRAWWWNEKRNSLIPYFDREIFPILSRAGATNKGAAFGVWMDKQVNNAGGHDKLEALMTTEFRRLRTLVLLQQRGEIFEQMDETRRQLYGSCPQDIASQVFRGVQVVIGAPVGAINRNIEMARRESGVIAQGIAVTTGVSMEDIQDRGPLGGDNSEARKVCDGIANIWGGKC
jgi:hypothetical protein